MGSSKPRCPHCGVYVKPENLPNHLRNVHRDESGADREARKVRASTPPRTSRAAPTPVGRGTWVAIAIVLLVILGGAAAIRFGGIAGSPYTADTPVTQMCIQHSSAVLHHHAVLSINILGTPYTLPPNIGITPECMRPLHTHDPSGNTIHIESPVPHTFTLGDFFTVWGKSFSSTQIMNYNADASHVVTMTVNGASSAAYQNLVLEDGQQIGIQYSQV